jgi:transcription antitermination factor NusG
MWNVAYASPHGEPQVCKYLAIHGIETYAPEFPPGPRTKSGSVRDRKHRWVFPGYVFFRIPTGFAEWDIIRWAPGVRRMLQEDGEPASLSDEIVGRLRQRLAERSLVPTMSRLRQGDRLVIESGPLRMVDAIFDKELDTGARLRILIDLLGRRVPVEVDAATVRAVG